MRVCYQWGYPVLLLLNWVLGGLTLQIAMSMYVFLPSHTFSPSKDWTLLVNKCNSKIAKVINLVLKM